MKQERVSLDFSTRFSLENVVAVVLSLPHSSAQVVSEPGNGVSSSRSSPPPHFFLHFNLVFISSHGNLTGICGGF